MSTQNKKEIRFPEFAERFNKLMNGRTLEEFKDIIGVSRPTAGKYSTGERIPDALTLKRIAETCGVTSDWLLGLNNSRTLENASVSEQTGLSEYAVKSLKEINFKSRNQTDDFTDIKVLSMLLAHDDFYKFLSSIKTFINQTVFLCQFDSPISSKEESQEFLDAVETLKKYNYSCLLSHVYVDYMKNDSCKILEDLLENLQDKIIYEVYINGKRYKKKN